MNQKKIISLINKIWINDIFQDCINDRIWMEADLVASFYSHIRRKLGKDYIISLEHKIKKEPVNNLGPMDAMIFHKNKFPDEPLAVMEFKHFWANKPAGNEQIKEGIFEDIKKLFAFKAYQKKIGTPISKIFFVINYHKNPLIYCKKNENYMKLKSPQLDAECQGCKNEVDLLSYFHTKEFKKEIKNELNDITIFYGYCPKPGKENYYDVLYSKQYQEDLEDNHCWEKWWGMKSGNMAGKEERIE